MAGSQELGVMVVGGQGEEVLKAEEAEVDLLSLDP